jgi:hypothetical protein
MKSLIVVFLTVLVLSYLASRALTVKAHPTGRGWIFSPINAVRIIYLALVSLALGLISLGIKGPQEDRRIVVIGGLLIFAFAIITWPKAIEMFELGVRQRSWYGKWKIILWSEIGDVQEKTDGSISIYGPSTKISLSKYHAGRDLFLEKMYDAKSGTDGTFSGNS